MLYRAQILLEPKQRQALTDIAQRQGRSLSDLVREIVKDYLDQQDEEIQLQQELKAIQKLTQIREQMEAQCDPCPVNLLEQVRSERDRERAGDLHL